MIEEPEKKEYWITKHWQSTGVYCVRGHVTPGGWLQHQDGRGYHQSFSKKEYTETLEQARIQVEAARKRRIASLQKSLKAVEACAFRVVPNPRP